MTRLWNVFGLALLAVALAGAVGCGAGGSKEHTISIPQVSPLDRVKTILQNYATGQPMGSESTEVETLIGEVRKTDPARADLLQRGFADLKRSPGNLPGKARALLTRL